MALTYLQAMDLPTTSIYHYKSSKAILNKI